MQCNAAYARPQEGLGPTEIWGPWQRGIQRFRIQGVRHVVTWQAAGLKLLGSREQCSRAAKDLTLCWGRFQKAVRSQKAVRCRKAVCSLGRGMRGVPPAAAGNPTQHLPLWKRRRHLCCRFLHCWFPLRCLILHRCFPRCCRHSPGRDLPLTPHRMAPISVSDPNR